MQRPDAYNGVDEILQADVMRFMAIIAFCLIAVLALVQSADPAPRQAQTPATPVPVPAARPGLALARKPQPAEPVTGEPSTRTKSPAVQQPVTNPEPLPRSITPAPAALETPPTPRAAEAVEQPAVRPFPDAPEQTADAPAEPASEPESALPDEAGLSLRFASDQDFLRLLNRGDIRVYAFRDGEVLSVGSDLALHSTSAPGQLHELLPETIPDLMAEALQRAHRSDTFRWGVAMPERIARQIRDYLDRGVSGELVIDRFGEVRHRET